MATNKSSSHHYYQIAPPIISSKFLSKSSESLSKLDIQSQKQSDKSSKMKKSQTVVNGFETKNVQPPQPLLNSTSALRRRFSLFRIKRSQQQQQSSVNDLPSENSNIQALQQIIDQLRRDLQIKTDELETMQQRIEKKRSSIAVPSNESIEQAMHLQTLLNTRLEEMLSENDLLKKSIQELEAFAQQQICKFI
jgi:predicted RNase H-like nuclease (RuvC/YqgF family)